jgi:hypothetical protein
MKVNRKSFVLVVVVLALVGAMVTMLPRLGGKNSAQAQQGPTLRGTYGFFTAGGSPTEAALGRLVADGNGNLTASSIILNLPTSVLVPGAPGRRSIPVAVTGGTYTVNADGTGESSATIQIPGQAPQGRSYDLLVTQVDNGVVTEAYLAQREFTTGGGLGYYRLKRVSN